MPIQAGDQIIYLPESAHGDHEHPDAKKGMCLFISTYKEEKGWINCLWWANDDGTMLMRHHPRREDCVPPENVFLSNVIDDETVKRWRIKLQIDTISMIEHANGKNGNVRYVDRFYGTERSTIWHSWNWYSPVLTNVPGYFDDNNARITGKKNDPQYHRIYQEAKDLYDANIKAYKENGILPPYQKEIEGKNWTPLKFKEKRF